MSDPEPPDDRTGHRARLRRRLFEGRGDALLDHELIEYLLATAIPRRDTKPLAWTLLREFGGIGGVLTADSQALSRVPGMGETSIAALKIAHAAAIRLLRDTVAERPVLANWQALLDYLRADMVHHAIERFRVLHLNKWKPVVWASSLRFRRKAAIPQPPICGLSGMLPKLIDADQTRNMVSNHISPRL